MIHLNEKKYEYWEEVNEGILKQIPQNKALEKPLVLDVGCGAGALAEAIEKKGYDVYGIETNSDAADKAALRIKKVLKKDLMDLPTINSAFGQHKFDYLIFSDV